MAELTPLTVKPLYVYVQDSPATIQNTDKVKVIHFNHTEPNLFRPEGTIKPGEKRTFTRSVWIGGDRDGVHAFVDRDVPLSPPADTATFEQSGSEAGYIAVADGQTADVRSNGSTLFYKATADVSSGSHDGKIEAGKVATFTKGMFVIAAQATTTQVLVLYRGESDGV